MLTNSLIAGALAAVYVVILILQLNPTLPLNPIDLAPLALSVGLFYVISLSAIAYVLLLIRLIVGYELFSPAWISVKVLAWLGAIAAGSGAVVMWANLRTFSLVLEAGTARVVTQGAIVLAAAAFLLLITAILQRHGSRRDLLAGWVIGIILVSMAVPLAFRGRGSAAPLDSRPFSGVLEVPPSTNASRVTVIAMDGGSLEVITNATSEGRLPNFGRILDSGAVTHLATLHPTSADAVWAAVATGKLPQKTGVRSAALYRLANRPEEIPIQLLPDFCFATGLLRFDILTEEPRTSASLRTRTLWTILSAAGVSVGIVNFPLTYPAPVVRGYLVSDAYARLAEKSEEPAVTLYPPDLRSETAAAWTPRGGSNELALVQGLAERYRAPSRTDRLYDRLSQTLASNHPIQVSVVRYQSADPIGHYFLRYAMPSRFGDVSDDDRRRYGNVLEAHYAIVDDAIGRAIGELGPDDLLIVVSAYGMEPLSVSKRVLERLIGDPEISGTHEAAPDGFLMAYGANVARARQLRRASVVDVLPTILYFLGLPVARDMDGYARADLFLSTFTQERPITFIPTYDR